MEKDRDEESLPEDEVDEVEDELVEWSDEPPEDVPEDVPEELPESPALVDHTVETREGEPEMVTYVRQPNGQLVPYKTGMDNR